MNQIGHNQPPISPISYRIDTAVQLTQSFCDGDPIKSEVEATEAATIKSDVKGLIKEVSAAHKAEKAPFLKGGREVDAKWKPHKEKLQRCDDSLSVHLTDWLARKEANAIKEQEQAKARVDIANDALNKFKRVDGDLKSIAEHEQLLKNLEKAESAFKATYRKSLTRDADGKAVTNRTVYDVKVINPFAAFNSLWPLYGDEITECFVELAKQCVRAGIREIPGFEIIKKVTAS